MKRILMIAIFFISFICLGQTSKDYNFRDINHNFKDENDINVKDILQIDDFVYFKKDTTLITGRVVKTNRKGKLKKVILIIKGKPDELGWIDVNFENPAPGEDQTDGLGKILTGVLQAVKDNN